MFDYHMKIFNRWGQFLWESAVYSLGWSGTTNFGDAYPEGTYFYLITYHYYGRENGELVRREGEKRGSFLLTR